MAKMPRKRKIESNEFQHTGDAHRKKITKERKRKTGPSDDAVRGSPVQRSSAFRGVTRHRWTGRFESHLWDKDTWNESQNKKGKQVYLGAYDDEAAAARAYDLAALKYWGHHTTLNFSLSIYEEELKEMEGQTKEEYIGSLRRKSSGFSRGVSKYRGVARHHHNGRWEARIGRVFGNKYLYLGTFATQEEAATAYDMAAIEHRGMNAVTNFDISRYINSLNPNSNAAATDPPETQPSSPSPSGPRCRRPRKSRYISNTNAPKSDESSESNPASLVSASGFGGEEDQSPTPERDRPRRRSFPDDIQTYFGCHEPITDVFGDALIFGELSSFSTTPFFSFDFDTYK